VSFVNHFIEWAHSSLLENDEACDYLLSRGSSSDQWARHKIGYISDAFSVDPSLDPMHSGKCFEEDSFYSCDSCRYIKWSSKYAKDEETGLKSRVQGQRIIGSVVFPLTTYSGQLAGFQIRSIKEKVYDTFTVGRRTEPFFFGTAYTVHKMWEKGYVSLVEGPFDHQVFERLVDDSVLAILTSNVSTGQLLFLKRFVDKINLCLDLDDVGVESRNKFIERHGQEFSVLNVKFPKVKPKDKDIGDLWKSVGDRKFSESFQKLNMWR
jgi:DNA primase